MTCRRTRPRRWLGRPGTPARHRAGPVGGRSPWPSPALRRWCSTSAGCCSPDASATRSCSVCWSGRAVQPRAGGRVLVDVLAADGAAGAPACRATAAPPTWTSSSPSTTSRSTSSSRPSPPPTRLRGRRRARCPARRRRPRRDGALAARHGATGTSAERAQRRQGGEHQPRPRAHRRRVRRSCSTATTCPRPASSSARSAIRRRARRVRADAAVLRQHRPRRAVAGAAWTQQALFFGPIARGKDGHDAMFCCGTNVVFRRVGARRRSAGSRPSR